MADDVTLNAGTGGDTIAADDIGGIKFQRVKIALGANNTNDGDVASGNPLPVSVSGVATSAKQDTGNTSLASIDGKITAVNTGAVVVSSSALPSGASTSAKQDTQITAEQAIQTSVELIDDAIKADDAAFTPATTKVLMAGFEFDDTTPDSVDEGDAGAARMSSRREIYTQLRDAAGNERGANVNASGQLAVAGPVTNAGTFAVQVDGSALTALQLIDDPVATLGTTTYTETSTKGMIVGAVRRDADTTLVDTTNEVGPLQMDANGRLKVEVFSGETLPVSLSTTAVTNAGTFAVQESGSALTALQLIDDGVYTDDTSTHSTGASKGYGIMAAATPTDGSVNANDFGHVAMTTDRKLHVAVMDALPAGTAAIGKLAANSGVDIGDVDVTSISAGSNLIGDVSLQPRTANGVSVMNASSSDGATALTNSAQAIKASAGNLYGYIIYNPNSAAAFVQFYNTASGSVTVGTTNPLFMVTIPPTSLANFSLSYPISFGTAISWAATSTAGGNGAMGTALDATALYK